MSRRGRPTIHDVARAAGVSPAAVSYIVSGPEQRARRISQETRARILDAVAELGYVPNQSARTLRLRRTNRVIFLGNRLTSVFSQAMAHSIEQALLDHGLALDVQIGTDADHIQRAIHALEQSQADGLIVEGSEEHLLDLREAARRGHAIVAIGPTTSEESFDVVSIDIAPAIEAAMAHLVERGRRHYLLLSATPDLQDPRVAIARRHLLALGVAPEAITVLHCPHDRIEAHAAALRFLPALPRPLAVYTGADVSAIGLLWACIAQGVRIPEEVSIIGHGNTPETRITVPPLTSIGPVSMDFRKAADLMTSRLAARALPGRTIAEPCLLTIRASS